jgi:hypothetical protein
LKVFISDISVKKGICDYSTRNEILGELKSGLEIYIEDHHYDLEGFIGCHIEMLLRVLRSPYLELERGIDNNQLFAPFKYYSIELIDELKKKMGSRPGNSKKRLVLTGEYIDSYSLPEHWVPRVTPKPFQYLLKATSALKTDDGVFLLNPIHLKKNMPIEKFPRDLSIGTGCIDLVAWQPI